MVNSNITRTYLSYVCVYPCVFLTKVKEVFVHHRPRNKNLLLFIHRYYDLGQMQKTQLLQEVFYTSGHLDFKTVFQGFGKGVFSA